MSQRTRLPNRRSSESFTFEVDGLRFTATVSHFPNGEIAELFLNNHKVGNQADTNARDAAILLSFALQPARPPCSKSRPIGRIVHGHI